ncbi:MAG TPA: nucleotidyltransferase family protein [Steroidobacteraceae bacterium]
MKHKVPGLRQLLFSMVAPGERQCGPLRELQDDEWDRLLTMARQHRLEPMLHWRAANDMTIASAPQRFRSAIAASFRQQALRSLELQSYIALIHRTMSEKGIPAIFLKGAFLAFHVYPHPALRPLRDLDVLVPRHQAMLAFESLLDAGFKRHKLFQGNARPWLECRKHLPPLIGPHGNVHVEIHTRATEARPRSTKRLLDSADAQLWSRSIELRLLGEQVRYLSPTDQLLHIIVHAVYDHRLNNGPLALHDISWLLGCTQIDWPLFWSMATEGDWVRGCWFMLQVSSQLDPSLAFVAPPAGTAPVLPEDCLAAMTNLMLGDPQVQAEVGLYSELQAAPTLRDLARVIGARAWPGSAEVAVSNSFEGSRRTEAEYLARWWRLATVRLPKVLASLFDRQVVRDARASASLQRWLAGE